jgi:fermentation-respiration switch protein FrsA (DUF1100 family)
LLKTIVIAAVGLYAVAAAVMYFAQRRFIYFPEPSRTLPRAAGLPDVSERVIATPDGEKLIAWYGKAQPGQPTLLYFHGNGGALEYRSASIRRYLNRGRGIFMLSYRGYSGSTGSPSEVANVADAKLAYEALIKEGVNPRDIILYGESLGTGVAIQVASEKKASGVILDSPFTSIVELAAKFYPWLPVSFLLKDRYDSMLHVREVHDPVFVVHGEADDIVPVEMGRRLFRAANEPKEIVTLPGVGHAVHDETTFAIINLWIDKLRAGQATAAE